jgi:beta-galactosidase
VEGKVFYIGAFGDTDLYSCLIEWIIDKARLKPDLQTPAGVEVMTRRNGDHKLVFVLNHTAEEKHIRFKEHYSNLLDESDITGEVRLSPYDILVLQVQN